MGRAAAFLDRDGVINLDHGYVHRWEDFEFVPGVVDGMRRLQAAGYALVVVTNQSGIARGYYDEAALQGLHDRLRSSLAEQGVELAAIEYCPHLPQAEVARYALECDCRKPAPGMILRAARALDLDLAQSLLFGDKPSDIEAGTRAGVGRCVLLATDGQPGAQPVDHLAGRASGRPKEARGPLGGRSAVPGAGGGVMDLPAALDALSVPRVA